MCKFCGGAHVTADRKCKQRFQIPYVGRHRRKERQRQDSNLGFQRGYAAEEDFPPLHTDKPGGASATQRSRSRTKGNRSRSRGQSASRARSLSRTSSVRITTPGAEKGPWATKAKKTAQSQVKRVLTQSMLASS
ncbi:hypothetical protein HPB51_022572 [Rhipicephalus microplus]|uniref:Uncharacterized protein n=1 Tax=Rhipicephalus microplus TaxID=6941 RepID=A0A9J6DJ99_RHIMP|nr:hypothetical protein HPB51_022572 [Rhipicephalus microplus]